MWQGSNEKGIMAQGALNILSCGDLQSWEALNHVSMNLI